MSNTLPSKSDFVLTSAQQELVNIWEEHTRCEFVSKNVDDTMKTMVQNPHVNHVPTMTGGDGYDATRAFYSQSFISQMPPDTETVLISRTIGDTQIVDELIFKFTHTVQMDWMLAGIAPTGKRVEVALVAIVGFFNGKISHEHIYWDQASVLAQLELIDPHGLPIKGIESAKKVAASLI